MKRLSLACIMSILFFTGCATWSTSSVDNKSATASSPSIQIKPNSILVIAEDITDKKYEVLGDIEVTVRKSTIFNSDPTREQVNKKLQEEASQLGANAVILVRYGKVGVGLFSWGALEGKGRAVRYLHN